MHMNFSRSKCIFIWVFLVLSGCEKPVATAEVKSASVKAVGPAKSAGNQRFELVIISRPERIADYLNIYKRAYDVCVAAAELQKKSVQPFLILAADFIHEKTTLVVDGADSFRKVDQFAPDLNELDPLTGCSMKVGKLSTTSILHNGQSQRIEVATDGVVRAEAPEKRVNSPMSNRRAESSSYTISKSHNGIALRCLPPGSAPIRGGLAFESCIYGGTDVTLIDEEGSSELLYARFKVGVDFPGVEDIRVREPQSLVVGSSPRSDLFKFVAATP